MALTKRIQNPLSVLCLAAIPLLTPSLQIQETDELQVNITQVDTSDFPTINVYVSITDGAGTPVGVEPGRLALKENGQPVEPHQIIGASQVESLTTLLVMDISGSMNEGGKLETAKSAAKAYVAMMRSEDRIGVIAFDTQVEVVQPLTSDPAKLEAAIGGLYGVEDTALFDALLAAVEEMQAVSGRKAIIALTDGMDNSSNATLEAVIGSIDPAGLTISTVGLGDPQQGVQSWAGLDVGTLEALAAQAGGQFALADNRSDLIALYENYALTLQSEYRISYTSPIALRDGVNRQLTVSISESQVGLERVAFNPGGLIPEVGDAIDWQTFAILLVALVLLLLLPGVVRRLPKLVSTNLPFKPRKKKPRIRFTDKQVDPPRIRLD